MHLPHLLRPAPSCLALTARPPMQVRRKDQELQQLRTRLDRLTAELGATHDKVRLRAAWLGGAGWALAARPPAAEPAVPAPCCSREHHCSLALALGSACNSASMPRSLWQGTKATAKLEQDLLNCQGELAVVNNRCAPAPAGTPRGIAESGAAERGRSDAGSWPAQPPPAPHGAERQLSGPSRLPGPRRLAEALRGQEQYLRQMQDVQARLEAETHARVQQARARWRRLPSLVCCGMREECAAVRRKPCAQRCRSCAPARSLVSLARRTSNASTSWQRCAAS